MQANLVLETCEAILLSQRGAAFGKKFSRLKFGTALIFRFFYILIGSASKCCFF